MHAVVADLVRSLLRGGFRRIVLLPTHGGNFAPLAAALEKLDSYERAHVVALTDLGVLFQIAQLAEREYGVPLAEGGLHAGEWETSLLLAIHPELVEDGARRGRIHGRPAGGHRVDVHRRRRVDLDNGAIGDPTRASREHGERYWSAVEEIVVEQVEG